MAKIFKNDELESLTGCHHSLTVMTVSRNARCRYLEETWLSGLPCCIPVNVEAWVTIPAGRDRQGDSNKLGQIADSLHVKSNTAACSEDLKIFLHLVQCSDV